MKEIRKIICGCLAIIMLMQILPMQGFADVDEMKSMEQHKNDQLVENTVSEGNTISGETEAEFFIEAALHSEKGGETACIEEAAIGSNEKLIYTEEDSAVLQEEEIAPVLIEGACGENLIWEFDDATDTLTISGTGSMTNYKYQSPPWLSCNVISVVLEPGVTTIGHKAFYDCNNMESIVIPDSITSIGENAFFNCTSLENVYITDLAAWCNIDFKIAYGTFNTNNSSPLYYADNLYLNGEVLTDCVIPDGVLEIPECAFSCNSLTNVIISDSVTLIGDKAFYNCDKLISVTIGDSVGSIGYCAFDDCSNLNNITLPDSVTSIETRAFANCSSLTNITIGIGVSRIESNAFNNCDSLTSVIIPDNVTSIGNRAFSDCDNLTSIIVPDSITSISEETFYDCDNLASIIIPDSVIRIHEGAFYNCDNLVNIVLPNNVTSIGEKAFYDCDKLNSITIPDSVASIDEETFFDCDNLNSIIIGNGVKNIGRKTFYNCDNLASIIIPDNVTGIGEEAFNNCDSLMDATIGDGVDSIGANAFSDCRNLTDLVIPDNVTSIGGGAFSECDSLTSIILSNSLTAIPEGTFSGCSSLTGIVIPDSVRTIGRQAFHGCSNLADINIGNGVTDIGSHSFRECRNLTSITIGSGVTYIGNDAFLGCEKLESVYISDLSAWCNIDFCSSYYNNETTWFSNPLRFASNLYLNGELLTDCIIPDGVQQIPAYAMSCDSIVSATIPGSVTSIGCYAFGDCENLAELTINEGVITIERCAFHGCPSLESVTLPDSVKSIGDEAFSWCENLSNFTIGDGVQTIGSYAFEFCRNLTNITIGHSVISFGDGAFYFCDNLENVYIFDLSEWCSIDFRGIQTNNGSGDFIHHYIHYYSNPFCYADKLYLNGELVTECVIPDGVTEISMAAFAGCESLNSITIPASVTKIGEYAFYECGNLVYAIIQERCENLKIDDYAFELCMRFFDLYFANSKDTLPAIESGLNNNGMNNATIHYGSDGPEMDEPEEETVTAEGSCSETVFWKIINDTLLISGEGTIPDYSQFEVPWYEYKTEITAIEIGEGITYVGSQAFSACLNVKTIVIPDGVKKIAYNSFSFNNCLRAIEIPASMVSIDYGAFFYCFHIEDIYFTGSEVEWNAIAIEESNFEYSEAVTIHFNSKMPENAGDSYPDDVYEPEYRMTSQEVRYFRELTEYNGKQSAAFGGYHESRRTYYDITEETDSSFLENKWDYLNNFVLVTSKERPDEQEGNRILIRLELVTTAVGVLSEINVYGKTITIEGQVFPVSNDVNLNSAYEGETVVYHILNGEIVGLSQFNVVQGKIWYWDNNTIQFANKHSSEEIESYILFENVSDAAKDFLGDYGPKEINAEIDCLDGVAFQFREWDAEAYYENLKRQEELQKERDKVNKWDAVNRKFDLWEDAVADYINTVNSVLGNYPAIEKQSKEKIIKQEAEKLRSFDDSAKNTFVIQPALIEGYEDEVYTALASFFLDGTCTELPNFSSLDYSSPMAFAEDVAKQISRNVGLWETKSYVDGNITITIRGTMNIYSNQQGTIDVYDGGVLKTTTVFATPLDGVKEMTQFFLKELEKLAVDVSWNVATSICNDLLKPLTGGSLASLTEDAVQNTMEIIGKKYKLNQFIYDEMAGILERLGVSRLKEALVLCASVKKEVELTIDAFGDIDKMTSIYERIAFEDFAEVNLLKEADKAAVKMAVGKLKGRADDLKSAFLAYFETQNIPQKRYNKLINQCPTVIVVYNSSGEQIGYVSEEELWHTDAIKINRTGDVKEIIALTDEDISFAITATDYGTMSCSLEEYNENSVPVGRLNYYDIVLQPNQTFHTSIPDHLDEEANSHAILSGGEAIYANEYVPLNDGAYVDIRCEQETDSGDTGGSVTGAGSYVRGDAVFLIAEPDEGFDFAGWFDGNTMVCEDRIYHFTAMDDRSLTAKFTKDYTVFLDLQESVGGMTLGEGNYLPGDIVNISAIPYMGYAFSGWYMGDELLSKEPSYSFEISTSITLHASFEPHDHSYGEPRFMWMEDNTCSAAFLCTDCNREKLVDCTISSITTPEADDVDKVILLAVLDFNGQTYEDTKTIFVPHDGHVHTEVIDPAVEPACAENGLSEGSHCAVCHNVLLPQTIIPAIGHKYVNTVCEYCGGIGGTCGENTVWEIDVSGDTLSISGTGAMYDYLYPGSTPWYSYRDKIQSVMVSEGVTQISPGGFMECRTLKTVSLPDTVETIGGNAFYGCMKLTGIDIPASVVEIGDGAFSFCSSLAEFAVAEENASYASQDGILYSKDMNVLVKYPEGKTESASFAVPESVDTIGRTALTNTCLTEVILHNDIVSLGYGAFSNSALSNIVIPEKVTAIEGLLFQLTNLTTVIVHENIESIGAGAFGACDKLSKIFFEGNAPVFGNGVFRDVTATAYYPEDVPSWTEDVRQNYGGTITWIPYGDVSLKLTSQPVDYIGAINSYASFSVSANKEDVRYQWYYSSDNGNTWLKSGSSGYNTDTLTVQILERRLGQLYRCEITDSDGNVVTSDAVTMLLPPSTIEILTQPADVYGAPAETIPFTVEATGDGLTYLWYYSNNDGIGWAQSWSEGYNTETLYPVLRAYNSGRLFKCLITDANGNKEWSEPAKMVLDSSLIVITTQPVSYEGAVNDLAMFSFVAEGVNLEYSWYVSKDQGQTWERSYNSGFNTPELQVRLYAYRTGYQYKCQITSGSVIVTETDAVTLSLRPSTAKITMQPLNAGAEENQYVTFRVGATGNALQYQWEFSNNGGESWGESSAADAKTDTFQVQVKGYRDGYLYRCKITDDSGVSIYTDVVTLRMGAMPGITSQPASYTGAAGETAVFTVETTGENLTYQWQYSNNGGDTWSPSGATGNKTNSISVALAPYRNGQMYRCVITNEYGSVISDAATLTVS